MRRAVAALFAGCLAAAATLTRAQERILDDFADLSPWRVEASEGVKASLRSAAGRNGPAMCLDFDFGSVSGYAIARRDLALAYPENYELTFGVRGDAKPNALQVKLVDASGENVWWSQRPAFEFRREWRPMRVRKRDIGFAWGPAADRALRRTASFEFAVARASGGRGSACFDRLALRELPAASAPLAAPHASASSSLDGSEAALAIDGSLSTAWRSDPAAGASQSFTIDFGAPREFGGLVLRWLPGLHASRYAIDFSNDGAEWNVARTAEEGGAGTSPILLTDSEARLVRVRMLDGPANAYGLAEVEVRDLAFGATPNAFFAALAKEAPRGRYPRGFSEQVYWTAVGVDGGSSQALLSEDGALEGRAGEGAIEPMLLTEEGLVTWADAAITQSLAQGDLPLPAVAWRRGEIALEVSAFGSGDRARSQIVARYTVTNAGTRSRAVTLVLALRPFQVNPPAQFLNSPGGAARMHSLAWNGAAFEIDGEPRIFALSRPARAFVVPFEAGNLPDLVVAGARDRVKVEDASGFPSGALLYRLELPPGGEGSVAIVIPLAGPASLPARDADAWMRARERETIESWREKLGRVALRLPPQGEPIARTLRTALAHILIERDGPALQPGTRAYARSWIRDGALMSEALLRMGHPGAVREFADWFAPHLFASGKVPCCVDRRGADPVPENDSHGEWIHLVTRYFDYTQDAEWLRAKWPGISRAVGYMDRLRAGERGDYAGLLPPSISHEGYSDKPAYSFWDDFWGLAGYRDAVRAAAALGLREEARGIAARRDAFEIDVLRSIRASMKRHRVAFVPGSADRGDFDATSTTIALSPGGLEHAPREALAATFERYWQEFAARRDGRRDWDAYTPYEWRAVGSFIRLGWRDRARELVDFFMADRRPAAWNQWAEVVGKDPRKPRFVGDMPHAWVAADFIRSALDMFAYERESDAALVLAGGVPEQWLEGTGISVSGLRTRWGRVDYSLRREDSGVVIAVGTATALPPGGLIVACLESGEVRIGAVPSLTAIPTRCPAR